MDQIKTENMLLKDQLKTVTAENERILSEVGVLQSATGRQLRSGRKSDGHEEETNDSPHCGGVMQTEMTVDDMDGLEMELRPAFSEILNTLDLMSNSLKRANFFSLDFDSYKLISLKNNILKQAQRELRHRVVGEI